MDSGNIHSEAILSRYITKTCPCNIRFFSPVKFENFTRKTDIFNIFAQNIVLTSTHNLCFGSKIRKLGKPLQTPFLNIKMGYKGVYFSQTCYPNDALKLEDDD